MENNVDALYERGQPTKELIPSQVDEKILARLGRVSEPEREMTDDDYLAFCEILLKDVQELKFIVNRLRTECEKGENPLAVMLYTTVKQQFTDEFINLLIHLTELPVVNIAKKDVDKYLKDMANIDKRVWNQADEIKKACPQ